MVVTSALVTHVPPDCAQYEVQPIVAFPIVLKHITPDVEASAAPVIDAFVTDVVVRIGIESSPGMDAGQTHIAL